jgi:hypothetical protein
VKYIFSNHAVEQIKRRNIDVKTIEFILENPNQTTIRANTMVYQAIIKENSKDYLIRMFVNHLVNPAVVITAYKTSKIDKYL